MRHLSAIHYLFLTLLVLCFCSLAQPACAANAAVLNVPVTYDQQSARSSLSLVNAFRAAQGKAPLQYDYGLERAAMQRAGEIVISFSHTSPSGGRVSDLVAHHSSGDVAENLAAGYDTAAAVVTAFREEGALEQGHRQIMLGDYQAIGIAHIICAQRHYWVQVYRSFCGDTPAAAPRMGLATVQVAVTDYARVHLSSAATEIRLTSPQSADLPDVRFQFDSVRTGAVNFFSPASVRWESEAPWIAKVDGTSVVAVGGGQTNLVASVGSYQISIPVTVAGAAAAPNLPTPSISKAVLTDGGVKLSWEKVPGAVRYRVFRKNGTGGWKRIADTSSCEALCSKSGLSEGVRYTFTVRCISADGKCYTSGYSKTGRTLIYREHYSTPKISSVQVVDGGVRVTWKPAGGSPKYRVFYKSYTGGWKRLKDTNATEYVWTGAKSGTQYTFTVRCIIADGKRYTSSYDKSGRSCGYLSLSSIHSAAVQSGTVYVTLKRPDSPDYLEEILLLCDSRGNVYSRMTLPEGKSSARLKLPAKGFWYIRVQTSGFVRTGVGSSRWTQIDAPEYRVVHWT